MLPKEKAEELYLKFCPYDVIYCDPLGREIEGYYERHAVRCALTYGAMSRFALDKLSN